MSSLWTSTSDGLGPSETLRSESQAAAAAATTSPAVSCTSVGGSVFLVTALSAAGYFWDELLYGGFFEHRDLQGLVRTSLPRACW